MMMEVDRDDKIPRCQTEAGPVVARLGEKRGMNAVGTGALLRLAEVDARLFDLGARQTATIGRLERVRATLLDAEAELKAEEIRIVFLESSPRQMFIGDALDRLRVWYAKAQERCRTLLADVEAQTAEAERRFDLLEQETEDLKLARRRLTGEIPEAAFAIYERCLRAGRVPAAVLLDGRFCRGCGRAVRKAFDDSRRQEDSARRRDWLETCPHCGRLLLSQDSPA
jgi:predicted  nucleic acid-binding Zn-ribbon protein